MGVIVNVLEKTEENTYKVKYELDGQTWEKYIPFRELKADMQCCENKFYFDCEVEFYGVDIDYPDNFTDTYAANLYKWVYHGNERDYKDVETKEFKKKGNAINQIKRWFSEYESEMLMYKHDLDEYIEKF